MLSPEEAAIAAELAKFAASLEGGEEPAAAQPLDEPMSEAVEEEDIFVDAPPQDAQMPESERSEEQDIFVDVPPQDAQMPESERSEEAIAQDNSIPSGDTISSLSEAIILMGGTLETAHEEDDILEQPEDTLKTSHEMDSSQDSFSDWNEDELEPFPEEASLIPDEMTSESRIYLDCEPETRRQLELDLEELEDSPDSLAQEVAPQSLKADPVIDSEDEEDDEALAFENPFVWPEDLAEPEPEEDLISVLADIFTEAEAEGEQEYGEDVEAQVEAVSQLEDTWSEAQDNDSEESEGSEDLLSNLRAIFLDEDEETEELKTEDKSVPRTVSDRPQTPPPPMVPAKAEPHPAPRPPTPPAGNS